MAEALWGASNIGWLGAAIIFNPASGGIVLEVDIPKLEETSMSHIKSSFVCCLLCLMVLGLTSLPAPQALTPRSSQASQGDGGQPLQALLSEVHELRLAIQRSNLNP